MNSYFNITCMFISCMQLMYFCATALADIDSMEPGQCLSRFDYDYKVMQKLSELESDKKEKCQERQSIAFMAQLTSNISGPKAGTTVIFDSVVTNDGQAYNPATGIFAAKVSGNYNFQITASSPTKALNTNLHLYLMRNSDQVGYMFLDANREHWVQRSVGIVIHLNFGDHVFVKFGRIAGTVTLAGCCFHTHFNGFLIHKN